jgi:hypothetical protein
VPALQLPVGADEKAVNVASGLQNGDRNADQDPFDAMKVDHLVAQDFPLSTDDRNHIRDDAWRGYRLMPLIFSAGPDGKYDIKTDDASQTNGQRLYYSVARPGPDPCQVSDPDKPKT